MQRSHQLLFLLLTLLFFSAQISVQGQILAEIITPDAEFCESGELIIEIKFGEEYEAPFEAYLSISNSEGDFIEGWYVDPYYPSAHNDNYTYSQTKLFENRFGYGELTVTIDEARDKNSNFSADNVAGVTKVTLYQTPSSYSAGDDISTCGFSTLLNATPGSESNSYGWEPVTGSFFSDASIANPLFTADEDGTYELTFTQTNGVCSVSDEVSVTLWGQPSATISTDSEICGSGDAEINFEFSGHDPWTVDYIFGTEAGQFTTSDNDHDQLHTLTGETIFQLLSVTDINGCSTTFTDEPGTSATVIDLLPSAHAGNDREVCADKITLSAGEPAFGTGTWSGGGSFSDINDKSSLFEPDPFSGEVTKTLTWTVNHKDCSASDQVNVTFYEQLKDTDISAGKDTLLYQQKSYTLNAKTPPFGQGTWSITPDNGLITEINNPQAEITQLGFGSTTLRWTVSNGVCDPKWDEVEIAVHSIKHPTGFSPNGDGKNDLLEIPGAKGIKNNQLIVFNQQGTVVYKTNNYQNNWNGSKENGEVLPDGYYYYIFTGEGVNIKDYLIIKRSMR